ncbi:unnamed protein product, partial [Lymnaea stagnalis]
SRPRSIVGEGAFERRATNGGGFQNASVDFISSADDKLDIKLFNMPAKEEEHSHSSHANSPNSQSPDTAGSANAAKKPTRKRG